MKSWDCVGRISTLIKRLSTSGGTTHRSQARVHTLAQPKTENGARDIPFGDHFKELLMPYRATGYVFGGEEPFQSWDYEKLMRRLKKRVNLHGATAHVLRHTYLTMLAGEGVDLKTLQTIAGHANIQTTMDIYPTSDYKENK